jgi:hypothetical protein
MSIFTVTRFPSKKELRGSVDCAVRVEAESSERAVGRRSFRRSEDGRLFISQALRRGWFT